MYLRILRCIQIELLFGFVFGFTCMYNCYIFLFAIKLFWGKKLLKSTFKEKITTFLIMCSVRLQFPMQKFTLRQGMGVMKIYSEVFILGITYKHFCLPVCSHFPQAHNLTKWIAMVCSHQLYSFQFPVETKLFSLPHFQVQMSPSRAVCWASCYNTNINMICNGNPLQTTSTAMFIIFIVYTSNLHSSTQSLFFFNQNPYIPLSISHFSYTLPI